MIYKTIACSLTHAYSFVFVFVFNAEKINRIESHEIIIALNVESLGVTIVLLVDSRAYYL